MPLQLGEDVGGIPVGLVLRHLELLLYPEQQLVGVPLELLQEVETDAQSVVLHRV